MLRIKPVDQNTADPATAELLNSVRKSMGAVAQGNRNTISRSPSRGNRRSSAGLRPTWDRTV